MSQGNDQDHRNRAPLEGVRVIDMTHSWAGPHCTRLLADYGAEVIRIEYPQRMCFFRGGKVDNKAYDKQTSWQQINRNKYSVALDLNNEIDSQMLRDLVAQSDVFISNSRPQVMRQLGFDYKSLKSYQPEIIMLSMTAFGETGPFANYCAYGAVMEGVSGIQSLTAYEPEGVPQRIREMDVTNGIGGAAAVVTALYYRQRTGRGQFIDLSQMELPTHALIGEQLLQVAIKGEHDAPIGNRSHKIAPHGCYPCSGEDSWITIAVRTNTEWLVFCDMLGQKHLANDSRFRSNKNRLENQDQLTNIIIAWSQEQNNQTLQNQLQTAGICATAVNTVADLVNDPHLKARQYFMQIESEANDSNATAQKMVGLPFKMNNTRRTVKRAPQLGEHNQCIGKQVLRRKEADIPLLNESTVGTAYDVH